MFLFQAAACGEDFYSVSYCYQKALPGTIPLKEEIKTIFNFFYFVCFKKLNTRNKIEHRQLILKGKNKRVQMTSCVVRRKELTWLVSTNRITLGQFIHNILPPSDASF